MLSRPDLFAYLDEGRLAFDPAIDPGQVGQVSIDLRLDRKFVWLRRNPPSYLPAVYVNSELWSSNDLWERDERDVYRLEPGQFVLGQTLERVRIPADLVGLVEGRSSFARVGITVHVTAPKIDPGFHAHVTLEMANFGRLPVDLRAGIDAPAQLMLLKLSTPLAPEDLYGAGPGDTFQNLTEPIPRRGR